MDRRMRFRASVDLHGKTATGIVVPPEVVDGLGSGKKPAVTVTIKGFSYPSTIASMGGRFLLPVSAEVRAGAGVAAGDVVDVDVALDTSTREVAVPADLAVRFVTLLRGLGAAPRVSAAGGGAGSVVVSGR